MTTYAKYDPTSLFAGGDDFHARKITVASGAGALQRGALLGVVTATGKAVACVKTASDGSQTPVAVLAYDIDATAADVDAQAYEEGAFAWERMTVDASWTLDALNAAFRAAGRSIFVRLAGAPA